MSRENSTPKAEVGERLKKARKETGLSQADFALKLGYPGYTAIRDIETGKTVLRPPIAKLIQFVFGISERWLLEGKGQMMMGTASTVSGAPEETRPKGIIEEWVQEVREQEGHDGRIVMELSMQVQEFRDWYKEKKTKTGMAEDGYSRRQNTA